jgi:hypothetical protein
MTAWSEPRTRAGGGLLRTILPRERIRMKRRCKLCGRARAVYRKFGICFFRVSLDDLSGFTVKVR